MAPLVKALKADRRFTPAVLVTGQHRGMLDQVLNLFDITPDFDLNIMRPGQTPSSITSDILRCLEPILCDAQPDLVLVHGDTSTTFAAAFAAFLRKIPVGHVEAGLRTGNLQSPWPEEANRVLTTVVTTHHFAPTEQAKHNLINESVPETSIYVTGNTVIDALLHATKTIHTDRDLTKALSEQFHFLREHAPLVLITGHRRENFGDGLRNICRAISGLADAFPDVDFVYPVHMNPNVRLPVTALLSGRQHVHLVEPLDYVPFVYLMNRSQLILTDSGGIQEEAPSLGKPVLVMRDTTERPEAISAGTAIIVGTDADRIISHTTRLLTDAGSYATMAQAHNPYGDGNACDRIIRALLNNAIP